MNESYELTLRQDNLYTNEVSFHDLNLIHDHADLAGPLRIRLGCNPPRFITRYRELKSKLEQLNLIDEASVDDAQLREKGEQTGLTPLQPPHYSAEPVDDLTEQPDANNVPEYLAQEEEGDESPASGGLDQATIEQQTDGAGSGVHAVDRFDEGESSYEAQPEQGQPAGDEESTADLLSGDEHVEQPVGVTEDDRERGTTALTASDGDHPGSVENFDATAVHGYSDVRNTPPLGGNSTEYEEAATINEDYEADYDENDQGSEAGETVTIEGEARHGDWETIASDAQQTRDDPEQHEDQHNTTGVDKREQVVRIAFTCGLTLRSTDLDTIDLTDPSLDDGPIAAQQGKWLLCTIARATSNCIIDTDTDSIGQQTLDEFTDTQEESRDDRRSHEGGESNSNTGECLLLDLFSLRLTQSIDQSNELIPDLDQLGDDFNWDEDFGGDFDDGEFGEFEDQSNVETKPLGSQEPISGRSSKRGFDEIDSDTADEEEASGDVSPSKFLPAPRVFSGTHGFPSRLKTEEGAVA